MASHWVVVLITTERFCAVCFPLTLGRMFSFNGTKIILVVLLTIVIGSQTWRLAFDYQEFGQDEENPNSTELIPLGCYARNMEIYFILDAFVNQLLLLFLLPALFILILNTITAWHISRSGSGIRKTAGGVDHKALQRMSSNVSTVTVSSKGSKFWQIFSRNKEDDGSAGDFNSRKFSVRRVTVTSQKNYKGLSKFRARKSIALLFLLTGCFLLCLMPQLILLVYLRVYHIVYGRAASFKAFLTICQVS